MKHIAQLSLERLDSVQRIRPDAWNALAGDNPFLRHEFLTALESTDCVGRATAWEPSYLTVTSSNGQLMGAVPLFVKYDSMGEFVFDWGWADAFERAGREYYPKLVIAVPFTPATGPRLLIAPDASQDEVAAMLIRGVETVAKDIGASSIHALFPDSTDGAIFRRHDYLPRKNCQFHWHNREYGDFSEFLSSFSSEKRKKVRRERRRIADADIRFEHLHGNELNQTDLDAAFEFHARTFLRRGRSPYLNRDFFSAVCESMPRNVVAVMARFQDRPIAAAICFRGADALYGRYWGSLGDFHSLHFETCYYQGIEYCIENQLATFEPGTQGEHKISRGFSPTATWSYHKIIDRDFHVAIENYLERETRYVDDYIENMDSHIPYKRKQP